MRQGEVCMPSSVPFTIYSASVQHFFFVRPFPAPIVISFLLGLDHRCGLFVVAPSLCVQRQSQFSSSVSRGWGPA